MKVTMGPAIRYQGMAHELRRALRKYRMATGATANGSLMTDDRERRRFQRTLRRAEIQSLRRQILGRRVARSGGDAA